MATLQERLIIRERDSAVAKLGGIIVSASEKQYSSVTLIVGRPGLPNLSQTLSVGGAVLYETPDGLLEVRVIRITSDDATVLLTLVAPRPGLAAGFIDQDQQNSSFTSEERVKINVSIRQMRIAMGGRSDLRPEQLAFIEKKLDEMQAASDRLGRKDWINWVLGTLTSIVVTLALDPPTAKALFQAADIALSWLFGSTMKFLGA